MKSFRSKHFPKSKNTFVVIQEYAMYYYALFSMMVMLGLVMKMAAREPFLWFAVIGFGASILLGNVFAVVKLKKTYAEIFFVGEHFSLISVHDILFSEQKKAFPTSYANARRTQTGMSFHFGDQIIQIQANEWERPDLIWEAFWEQEEPQFFTTTLTTDLSNPPAPADSPSDELHQ